MTRPAVRYATIGAAFVVVPWISIALLSLGQATWLPWLQAGGWLPGLGFVAAMAILCGCAVLGTQAASVAAGYALGFGTGASLVLIGTALAAVVGYAVFVRLSNWWQASLLDQPRARALSQALGQADSRTTVILVALMRLAPVMPFGATNLLMAANRVRQVPFVIGTMLGFSPLALVMTRVGSVLAEFRFGEPPPVSLWVYLGFLLVAGGGLGVGAGRVLARLERQG